jgi:8-oxo-dGTP diphosphatase
VKMKLLKLIKDEDVISGAKNLPPANFRERTAARAVLFDAENKIALLHVRKQGYYKLPGGGLDGDETVEQGLERELLEETGCHTEITGEVGEIEEYRNEEKIHQRSFIFLARVVGEKGETNMMDDELEEDFHLEWVGLRDALDKIKNANPKVYEGHFIQKRDQILLETVINQHLN